MNEEMKKLGCKEDLKGGGMQQGGANEWSWRGERDVGEGRRRKVNRRGKKCLQLAKREEGKEERWRNY